MNAGHFPREFDTAALLAHPSVGSVSEPTAGLQTLETDDGRRLHILGGGHMVNLAGPSPLGNSIESMDIGFAMQARCLEAIATDTVDPGSVVVPVPRRIDEQIAEAYLGLLTGSRDDALAVPR
jgi:adenosylhomocysteinase